MNREALGRAVNQAMGFAARDLRLQALAGDGSDRRYWRAFFRDAKDRKHTLVVMDLLGVENVVKSEEVTLYHPEDGELPFLNIHRFLTRIGVPVPRVFLEDRERGFVLLEDLGDELLLHAARDDPARREALYAAAVDILADMHCEAAKERDEDCLAFRQSFTEALLLWEMRHFTEYGIEKRRDAACRVKEADLAALDEGYRRIAVLLAGLPRVFTHRDYHSRNLLVRDGKLWVIDFQDALLGPAVYDLASLLRDSYIDIGDDLVDRMIERYLARREEAEGGPFPRQAFRRDFDYQSLQRNLKAVGRFGFFDVVKGNPNFLPDVPRTLGYVRKNLQRYPELHRLRDALARYRPELGT